MHLVLLTRGHARQIAEWKAHLLAQRFPWKRRNLKTGKEELHEVQGALRPIQIWEYIFPEESLDDVLTSMKINKPIERPEIKKIAWLMRKMLGLQNIPVMKDFKATGYIPTGTLNGGKMPALPVHSMFIDGVATYPLGIKRDERKDFPQWGFNQEAL